MCSQALRDRVLSLAIGVALLLLSDWASADPPSRVARLSFASGGASFSPAGENTWFPVVLNRPLTTEDRLWTDASGRVELEISGAMLRLNGNTSAAIVKLDDQTALLQLSQGIAQLRVRHLDADQSFEIRTPNVGLAVHQNGDYRITVDPLADATDIVVRRGRGEALGDGSNYVINAGQAYHFSGTGLRDYLVSDAPRRDEFELWASDRDRADDNSISALYVSPGLPGYQALDAHGSWHDEPGYGYVWAPRLVGVNWAPYRDGHWVWINPWGWTWIDDAPWGFTVSHYGRWVHLRGHWCWLPGPPRSRPFYAPALVAFEGGNNFQLAIGSTGLSAVAWFPLGPREVYRPPYATSLDYFRRVNHNNTVINKEILISHYRDERFHPEEHVNRRIPGAIVTAPANSFVRPNIVQSLAPTPQARDLPRRSVEPRVRTEQHTDPVRRVKPVVTAPQPALRHEVATPAPAQHDKNKRDDNEPKRETADRKP